MENEDLSYCDYSGLPSPSARIWMNKKAQQVLTSEVIDRIIEMAWEDRTTFDAIRFQFGLNEVAVKKLMKKQLKFSSYRLWRKRVEACNTKHAAKRVAGINRFKCDLQRIISNNKISKRK